MYPKAYKVAVIWWDISPIRVQVKLYSVLPCIISSFRRLSIHIFPLAAGFSEIIGVDIHKTVGILGGRRSKMLESGVTGKKKGFFILSGFHNMSNIGLEASVLCLSYG